jgi:hypothetical protein
MKGLCVFCDARRGGVVDGKFVCLVGKVYTARDDIAISATRRNDVSRASTSP